MSIFKSLVSITDSCNKTFAVFSKYIDQNYCEIMAFTLTDVIWNVTEKSFKNYAAGCW